MGEKANHSVEPELVKLEKAGPHLEEAARGSEGEEESKPILSENVIANII